MSADTGTSTGWVGREARQARLGQVQRRRHDAERQVGHFREQLDRIARQLREALDTGRKEYARELLSRRLNLRARLSEVEGRREVLLDEERRLVAGPAPSAPPAGSSPPVLPPTSVPGRHARP